MNMRHNKFTLVELLVVICIASLLMGLVLPAFNRMVTGSAVDRLASNLKVRIERAQAHSASSRRYVALMLPNGSDWSTDTHVKNSRLGGSRMCYVDDVKIEGEGENKEYTAQFARWVPDEDWITPERGALLVAVSSSDPVDAAGNLDSSVTYIKHGKEMTGSIVNGSKEAKPLKKTKGVKFSSSEGEKDVSDSAIVFSPRGGVRSTADVYLVIAEAMVDSGNVLYPGGQINNFRVLKINRLTGKVEYHR